MSKLDEFVFEYIKVLNGWSTSQRHLAAIADTSERTIRASVRRLRLGGALIASGNKGYWIAKSEEEIRHTLNRMYSQNKAHIDVCLAMERTINEQLERGNNQ
jgi:biotin operon repressor